ncbi:MAG: TonB-dependent receptor [Acidobacteria bacterium]|nr:TonB-dependent receptor [Acidobacteriota bacterium]
MKTIISLVLLCTGYLAMAQVETARITGTVKDSSGALVVGATITATHIATGSQQTMQTDQTGHYLSVPLRLGEYRVEAEMQGFKHAVLGGIVLEVQMTARVDFSLEVGRVTDSVTVTADEPLLATTEASQGQVIDNRRMVDMPLNGRNYAQLALLSAGAVEVIGGRFGGFSASGQRADENNYMLDGIDNNNNQIAGQGSQAEAVRPSVDAIQEFKISTNAYSAEYGRGAGGVVNVSLKSGSNDLHGTVFEFLRNEALDARNFFSPGTSPKPPFKRNQFGFSLGGPIRKNRTFVFGDYEGTRIRESRVANNTIPTARQVTGDFSDLLSVNRVIFDPNTYDATAGTRLPFAGNVIPANRIDPVARKAMAWYPQPQNGNLTQNFLYTPPKNSNVDRWDARADHIFSSSDSVYFRFSYQRNLVPDSLNLPAPAMGISGDNERRKTDDGRNLALVWNHLFRPTLITSTRIGWNRLFTQWVSPLSTNMNAEIGLRGVEQVMPGAGSFNITGVTGLGLSGSTPNLIDSQTRQLVSDTTWVKGAHSVKAGVNFMFLQSYLSNPQQGFGTFSFNGNFTRNPRGNVGGYGAADFLLGIPVNSTVSTNSYMNLRAPFYHFYLQDDWRVTARLTLNIGLRYELNLPWIEKDNLMANFDIDTNPANPLFRVAGGSSRTERATVTTDKTNVAPRFGFAYQLSQRTVLRGGYGIFIANREPTGGTQFMENNPPFSIYSSFSTDSIKPVILLKDGVPAGALTPERASNLVFSSFQHDAAMPFSQQWNFNLQRQLARSIVWEVGYYAAKTNHLIYDWNANYALPGPGNVNSRRRFKTTIFPGTNTVIGPLSSMYRHDYFGNSLFHSMQTRLDKRFSSGVSLLVAYTFSKTIGDSSGASGSGNAPGTGLSTSAIQNPLNRRLERSLDNQNMKHRLVASYLFELPFGPGKKWGSDWNPVSSAALGGWTIGGITTMTSGLPMSLTTTGDAANTGDVNRPDVVGDPSLSRSERSVARFFNTAAFAANKAYTYGNAGRNILDQPGLVNFDFAAFKEFRIKEAVSAQFRFEAFNLFNTPAFGAPNTQVGNLNFGRITTAGRQRNLQLGLKFVF